jgi:alkanesulfonate monooxygenase SsuD/methylene tetrahydromethanopterin reductase-like flavin-dependent oxidoreductase (luciferase family)
MKGYVLEGAASAGKQPQDVALIFNSCVAVDEDRERARVAAKPYVALGLSYRHSTWLPEWSEQDRERFREQYDYYHHLRSDHEIAELVPDHLVTRKSVSGTPDDCLELLRMVVKSGFTKVALLPMGNVEQTLRLLATKVLPKL